MPQPTLSEVHVNRPLTDLSIAYLQRRVFLANDVFPIVPVAKKSDSYFTYPISTFRKARAQKRAAGAAAVRMGYSVSTSNYSCDRDALAHDIPDPIRANADQPLNLDREAMEFLTMGLMLTREVNWCSTFFTTSTWTGSSTGSDITVSPTWDVDTSTPIEDVQTEIRAIEQNTGLSPNRLVLGRKAFDDLTNHPDILDRIKYSSSPGSPAMANEAALAALFGVERVLVARASRDTSADGTAASNSFIANTRSALLVYAAPTPGIMTPSGGYTFAWQATGNDMGIQVKTYRNEEKLESDAVEVNLWTDDVLISGALGSYFSNAVAA